MADDFRFIHREESFEDLAVRELAKSRSACMCKVQFGRCTREQCRTCRVNLRYQKCYKQLSDYDKQRCDHYTAEMWLERSRDPIVWSSFRGVVLRLLGWIVFAALFMSLPFLLFECSSMPAAKPDRAHMPAELDRRIVQVMKLTHSQVRDLNRDGLVNCIDYTCTFKREWDATFPERKTMCTIIRNYNPFTKFHHLFIRIYDGDNLVYVEPRADNPYRYLMEENWTSGRYDPRFDIVGETYDWMERVKYD